MCESLHTAFPTWKVTMDTSNVKGSVNFCTSETCFPVLFDHITFFYYDDFYLLIFSNTQLHFIRENTALKNPPAPPQVHPLSLSSQFAAILIKMVRTLIFRQNLNPTITA